MRSRIATAVAMSKLKVFEWCVIGFLLCVGVGAMLTAIVRVWI